MRNRAAILATLLYALLAIPLGAQSKADTAHVKAQQARLDSARVALDSLRRWCRVASYQSPKYLRKTCGLALAAPDVRARAFEDSLLIPPPPVVVPPPVDTQPTPPPPIVVPPSPSVAELPRVFLSYSYPTPTQTITVTATGLSSNLQSALNQAAAATVNTEVALEAGGTWSGNFIIPVKSCATWALLRSSRQASLPGMGIRVGPSHASLMPRIMTPNTQPALATASGTCGWWLTGIEVTIDPALTAQQYGIITLGGNQSTAASAPRDLVFDRMYVHGQPTSQVSRCVAINSARTQITDSYLDDCHGKGFQAQAIAGWNGAGPFKIVNNYMAASGEQIFFGGADPATPGLIPSDIEIRRNHLFTPQSWRGVWGKANLLETKNAVRVLIEANVMDGSWADIQTGWAIILKSENQAGNCRWCRTTDVTIRRNLIRNAGAGINIAPRTNGADSTTSRIAIYENVLENIGTNPQTTPVPPQGNDLRGFQLLTQTKAVTLERNVLAGTGLSAALITEGGTPCVFRDQVLAAGAYGAIASGFGPGLTSITSGCGTAYTWTGMALVGSSGGNAFPAGTVWLASESQSVLAAQIRAIVSAAIHGVVVP